MGVRVEWVNRGGALERLERLGPATQADQGLTDLYMQTRALLWRPCGATQMLQRTLRLAFGGQHPTHQVLEVVEAETRNQLQVVDGLAVDLRQGLVIDVVISTDSAVAALLFAQLLLALKQFYGGLVGRLAARLAHALDQFTQGGDLAQGAVA